ncbi:MAG: glycosyltransferase family 4 protein [Planctomycetes bacterium]|nr:glycosyltransferase family 4 protein [Planctomycetota bacterium]
MELSTDPPEDTPAAPGRTSPLRGLRAVVVGPASPLVSGMSVQADALTARLRSEHATVIRVATNPGIPALIAAVTPIADSWRLSRFRGDLCRAIAEAPDFVHVHAASWDYFRNIVAPVVSESADAGVPCVVRWDGGDADRFLAEHRAVVEPILRMASAVVVPTGFLADVFRARIGTECDVIPNLVPDPQSDRPPVAPSGPIRLLCARHLTRAYGVDVVLKAAAVAAARGVDLRLTIVGDGPERDALREAARAALGDRATFLGAVPHDQFLSLLRETDLLVNGSWMDNFPVSMGEALSCGVPVATTDAGGVRWVVQHGRTGLVTPTGDAEALGGSIAALALDRAMLEDLGWRAKVEALRWTWQAVRDSWIDVWAARSRVIAA